MLAVGGGRARPPGHAHQAHIHQRRGEVHARPDDRARAHRANDVWSVPGSCETHRRACALSVPTTMMNVAWLSTPSEPMSPPPATVSSAVGVTVGVAVGRAVGVTVGARVGEPVGWSVGTAVVGRLVGSAEGCALGFALGMAVGGLEGTAPWQCRLGQATRSQSTHLLSEEATAQKWVLRQRSARRAWIGRGLLTISGGLAGSTRGPQGGHGGGGCSRGSNSGQRRRRKSRLGRRRRRGICAIRDQGCGHAPTGSTASGSLRVGADVGGSVGDDDGVAVGVAVGDADGTADGPAVGAERSDEGRHSLRLT